MDKFIQKSKGRVELFEVANAAELKTAVKQFIAVNLTRLIASNQPLEQSAKNVTQMVNFVVNEGVEELLHSLKVIQAQNEKINSTTH